MFQYFRCVKCTNRARKKPGITSNNVDGVSFTYGRLCPGMIIFVSYPDGFTKITLSELCTYCPLFKIRLLSITSNFLMLSRNLYVYLLNEFLLSQISVNIWKSLLRWLGVGGEKKRRREIPLFELLYYEGHMLVRI